MSKGTTMTALRGFCVLALCALAGCKVYPPRPKVPPGAGLGAACGDAQPCRDGLVCDSATSTCAGSRSLANGATCTIGPECESGYCGPGVPRGKCGAAGTVARGGTCQGDGDCQVGLKCAFDGETLFPRCLPAGPGDLAATCTWSRECAQGLFCQDGVCSVVPLAPQLAPRGWPPFVPDPTDRWAGASCPAAKSSPTTALFELPRQTDTDEQKADFFRLPFPNDAARRADGTVDYSRFPRDPAPPFGFDALGRYLSALETEPFGNYGTTHFRFSGPISFSGVSGVGANPQTRLVDLTAGARFGQRKGLFWRVNSGRNRYICNNWVAVRPFTAEALVAGTYGVVLLKGIKDETGNDVQASGDFQAMLSSSAPSGDPVLGAAWPRYAPLRQYLSTAGIATSDVLVASVFTVGDGQRLLKKLAQTVAALPVPAADGWVKCGSGTPSPCADATGARACGNAAGFDEWHSLLDLPIFQSGSAPYLTPAEGGSIDGDLAPDAGVLAVVRREQVCAALTTPKTTPPAGGWPLVVYGHGTGGSFRSHAGDGAGAALAQVAALGDGGTADGGTQPGGYAVLGIDQVGHGPRRGARQDVSPDDIVFNFSNPASARGTMAQGGADLLGVARYAKGFAGGAGGVPAIDSSRLVYWGHSQGATQGALFLAQDRSVEGALMTGASASLSDALLSKKAPINIADSMWIALGEAQPSDVDIFHPVISLLASWTDPVDPLNFARDVVVVPAAGATPAFARHLFQVWGKNDLFTARPVQAAFALGAGLGFVAPKVDDFDAAPQSLVSGNVTTPRTVTAAMRQYDPGTLYDGHFVVFRDQTAQRDAVRFLVRAASGDVPRVPEP